MIKSAARNLATSVALLGLAVSALPVAAASGGGSGGTLPSQSAPEIDPVQAYRQGVQHYRAGEYAEAEAILRRGVRQARRDARMHYVLGLSRFAQEKFRTARRSFQSALRYNGDLHDARLKLGLIFLQKPNTRSKAIEQLAELDARLETCAETCPPDLVSAADALRAAIAGDTTDQSASVVPWFVGETEQTGDLFYLDAVRLINLERYDEAQIELSRAAAVFGPHPDILTYQGFAHRKSGAYTQAIAFYQAALSIDPDHLGANEYLGEYYVELGDLVSARRQLDRLDRICDFGCAEADELLRWIEDAAT